MMKHIDFFALAVLLVWFSGFFGWRFSWSQVAAEMATTDGIRFSFHADLFPFLAAGILVYTPYRKMYNSFIRVAKRVKW